MLLNKLKKIIPALLLAATCLSLLPIGVPVVHAQTATPGLDDSGGASTGGGQAGNQAFVNSTNSLGKIDTTADDTSCSFSSKNGAAICISNIVYFVMVGVFSSLAYIAAFFFDIAVQLSLNSTTYALGFLTTSWEIVRDLSNMAFIFILIYIAVSVMLTADSSQTIKTLAMVVVVALLVNFSFFFTRVAIDAGNLLALQFYNAIEGHAIGQNPGAGVDSILNQGSTNATNFATPLTAIASSGNTKDLTASIMDGIQVQNILNSDSFKNYAKDPTASSMYILITLSTIYIAVGIAFGILAGSFLYAGAKFMMRIVGLWFVIIFSPLALVAAALPSAGANKLFKDWLKHLVNFSFYPAAFLFMFFVLTRFMKELNKGGNFLSGIFAQPLAGNDPAGFLNILSAIANVGIRLGFVVAMMYLALSAADILAKSRGDITSSRARSWAGWMGNAITGGAIGWAGRNTLGRIPALSGRTFDIRNAPVIKQTVAPLLRRYEPATSVPHSTFGATPISFGQPASPKDAAKAAEEASKERDRKRREDEFHVLLKKAADNPGSLTPVETDRLNKADKKEIAGADGKLLVKAAKVFSEKTVEKILEKEDFKEKEDFHKNWHEEASGAPLNKADKMIEELERINSRLAAPMPSITAMTVAGTAINKALLNPIKDTLEAARDDAQADHKLALDSQAIAPSPANLAAVRAATTQLRNTTQAFEKAKGLVEALPKVPAGIGGAANAGEFTKK